MAPDAVVTEPLHGGRDDAWVAAPGVGNYFGKRPKAVLALFLAVALIACSCLGSPGRGSAARPRSSAATGFAQLAAEGRHHDYPARQSKAAFLDLGTGSVCRSTTEDHLLYPDASKGQGEVYLRDVTDSECREMCAGDSKCHGYEVRPSEGRCELWTVPLHHHEDLFKNDTIGQPGNTPALREFHCFLKTGRNSLFMPPSELNMLASEIKAKDKVGAPCLQLVAEHKKVLQERREFFKDNCTNAETERHPQKCDKLRGALMDEAAKKMEDLRKACEAMPAEAQHESTSGGSTSASHGGHEVLSSASHGGHESTSGGSTSASHGGHEAMVKQPAATHGGATVMVQPAASSEQPVVGMSVGTPVEETVQHEEPASPSGPPVMAWAAGIGAGILLLGVFLIPLWMKTGSVNPQELPRLFSRKPNAASENGKPREAQAGQGGDPQGGYSAVGGEAGP